MTTPEARKELLRKTRAQLQKVADKFCEDGTCDWRWDETHMHLTISDNDGKPIATLHVEPPQ